MSLLDKMAAAFPAIATQAELEQRIRDRAAPAADYNLTPDGPETPNVHSQTALSNERRIAHLERRFERERQKIERDHSFARLGGKARADFGRCSD